MARFGAYSPIAGNANIAGLTQALGAQAGQMGMPIAQVATQQAQLQQQVAAGRRELAGGLYRNAAAVSMENARIAASMAEAGMNTVGTVMRTTMGPLMDYYRTQKVMAGLEPLLQALGGP